MLPDSKSQQQSSFYSQLYFHVGHLTHHVTGNPAEMSKNVILSSFTIGPSSFLAQIQP